MLSFTVLSVPLLLSLQLSGVLAAQKCYGLNGTALDDTYGPCKSGATHSGCCAINRPAGSTDVCLDNGLCMATNGEYMGTIWQDGCTDPTGQDEGCPKLCPDVRDNFNGLEKVLAWNIQTCDFGSYCCRAVDDHNNCCNNATAPKIQTNFLGAFQSQTSTAGLSATSLAASTASSSASTPATTTSSEPSSTASPLAAALPTPIEDMCKAEKQKTAVVGGTVGGIMGAAIMGLLGVLFWMHTKEKRQRRLKEHYESQFQTGWSHRPRTIVVEVDSSELGSRDGPDGGKEEDVVVHDYRL